MKQSPTYYQLPARTRCHSRRQSPLPPGGSLFIEIIICCNLGAAFGALAYWVTR